MKTNANFKTPKTLSLPLFLTLMVAVIAFLASCHTNVNNQIPPAGVMAVNSAQGSSAQDFYLDNAKSNSSPILYTQSQGYFYITAGDTHQAQFKTSGSAVVNASTSLQLSPGGFYDVVLTDNNGTSTYPNDRTSPQPGNSRVRFINVSAGFTANADFAYSVSGKATVLASNVANKAASAYYDVSGTINNFSFSATGSTSVLLNIPITLQAGKIYTIFISGTTQATLASTIVAEN